MKNSIKKIKTLGFVFSLLAIPGLTLAANIIQVQCKIGQQCPLLTFSKYDSGIVSFPFPTFDYKDHWMGAKYRCQINVNNAHIISHGTRMGFDVVSQPSHYFPPGPASPIKISKNGLNLDFVIYKVEPMNNMSLIFSEAGLNPPIETNTVQVTCHHVQ